MPSIIQPQLGKHLTAVSLTGQAVNATTGALTDSGSAVSVLANIDGLNQSFDVNHEEISALNSARQNNVILDDGATLEIQIFKLNSGTPNALRTLVNSFDYIKAVWIEGTGGAQRTQTFYGLRGAYSEGFQGKGKQIASLTLVPVDVNDPNPTYAS